MTDTRALNRRIQQARTRIFGEVARCFRACFCEPDGRTLTLEGNRVLAHLRATAKMDEHNFIRDLRGRIDPLAMARIEGRRELYREVEKILKLDDATIRQLVEVKDA